MGQVTITINSREYAVVAEDGQESNIFKLAQILDEKAKMITTSVGQINENMLLAMVGLLIADELAELKKDKGIPIVKPKIDMSQFEEADEKIATSIKNITGKIKNIVNLL